MKLKITSGANNLFQFVTQISLPTNIDPSLWVLDDSFINIRGLEATDTVEVKKASDNITLYTFTGAGIKSFTLGLNYDVSVYFVRKDSLGNVLLSTIKIPIILTIGDNGIVNLFYGSDVQLAQNSDIALIKTKVDSLNNYNDTILIGKIDVIDTNVDAILVDLEIINQGVKKASLLIPHTTNL
jgi:hypothetical protein